MGQASAELLGAGSAVVPVSGVFVVRWAAGVLELVMAVVVRLTQL